MAYGRSTFNPNLYPGDTWKDWINEDGEWSPFRVAPRHELGIMLFEGNMAMEKDASNTERDKSVRRRAFGGRAEGAKKTARDSEGSDDSDAQQPRAKRNRRAESDDEFLPQAQFEEVVNVFAPVARRTPGAAGQQPRIALPPLPAPAPLRGPATPDGAPAPLAVPLRTSPRRARRNDQARDDDAVLVERLGDLYPNDNVVVTGYGEYYQLVSVPKQLNVRFEDTQHALKIHLTRSVGSVNNLLAELTNKFQALKAHFLMPLEKDAYEQRSFRFTISIPAPQHLARPVAHRQVLRGETDAVIAVKWESAEDDNMNDFVS